MALFFKSILLQNEKYLLLYLKNVQFSKYERKKYKLYLFNQKFSFDLFRLFKSEGKVRRIYMNI